MGSGEHLGDPCICCGVPHDNEQRAVIQAQDERIEQLLDIIQAAHNTFTQGGTDPADDDVISVLMAKILEEALT